MDSVHIVSCGLLKPQGFVPWSICEKCSHYGGGEKVFTGTNGLIDLYEITCKLPVRKRLERLAISESPLYGGNDGSTK